MIDLTIQTDRLILKPMTLDDAEALYAYRSRPEVYRYQTWAPEKIADAEEFISAYSYNKIPEIDHWFQFGIYKQDQLIGDCGFCLQQNNRAEIGYTISPDFQKMGHATEAVRALLNFLCSRFYSHLILAHCDPRNTASIFLLKKLGFGKKGFYPKSVHIRNEWQDDVIYMKTLL